ncbi:cation diffusion facilitator family transporter [Pseudochelatococcus sp. G4_1912]|uniref:cation diffusion facilitator family transporter n=1 Tax=Pseudochelatococcus sp. G4_1912 TaxID=3114288 RepID=UPI0039C61E69
MSSEEKILRASIAATVIVAITGIVLGALSGSFSIIFDGSYALVDAVMSGLALFVARLISRHASGRLNARRFTMGFWHLEPMVLALNGILLMAVSIFALVNAIGLILNGGRALEFDWAIAYAAMATIVCFAMAFFESRMNETLQSRFITLDARAWVMSGGINLALLIAFVVGYILDHSAYDTFTPYVDPIVLAIICVVITPLPYATVKSAVQDIILAAPSELVEHVEQVARDIIAKYGFKDYEAYVARIGRAQQMELHFILPPDYPIKAIGDFDAIREEVGNAIGSAGPHRWLTLSFTADPKWAN